MARDQREAEAQDTRFPPGPWSSKWACGDPEAEEPGDMGVGGHRAACLSGLIPQAPLEK